MSSKKNYKDSSINLTKNKKASLTKKTWENFLRHKKSKDLLKKSWSEKNPQKHFKETLKILSKQYRSKKIESDKNKKSIKPSILKR